MSSKKRALEFVATSLPSPKRQRRTAEQVEDMYNRIATFENANRVRQDPPVAQLQDLIRDAKRENITDPGRCTIYWMRMQDMRGNVSICRMYAFRIDKFQSRTTAQYQLPRHLRPSTRFPLLSYLQSAHKTMRLMIEVPVASISCSATWIS